MALILLIYPTSPITALAMAADLTLLGGIILTIIGLLILTGIILIAKQAQQFEDQANQLYEQADRLRDLANHLRILPFLDVDRNH